MKNKHYNEVLTCGIWEFCTENGFYPEAESVKKFADIIQSQLIGDYSSGNMDIDDTRKVFYSHVNESDSGKSWSISTENIDLLLKEIQPACIGK